MESSTEEDICDRPIDPLQICVTEENMIWCRSIKIEEQELTDPLDVEGSTDTEEQDINSTICGRNQSPFTNKGEQLQQMDDISRQKFLHKSVEDTQVSMFELPYTCSVCKKGLRKNSLFREEGDNLFSDSEYGSESEYESDSLSESECESAGEENEEGEEDTDDDSATPPPSKIRKGTNREGWEWSETGEKPSKFNFTGNPGINSTSNQNLPPDPNPLDVFQLMVHDSLWEEIATETNRYAAQFYSKHPDSSTSPQWFPTTCGEMKAYFALCILMAQVKKPNLQSYWSIRKSIHTPFFSETIPFKRFVLLSKFLHFTNNESLSADNGSLGKIAPVLEHLRKNFRSVYYPQKNVAVDESLIKSRRRLCYIEFNPQKRAHFGIKIYKICESVSGYCLGISVYTGRKPNQAEGEGMLSSEAIVMELMEPYLQSGHTVYVDNWFTSPSLFLNLAEKQTNAVGMVRVNRRNMPHQLKSVKLGNGQTKVLYSHKMMALQWMDRKPVTLLSTCHSDVRMKNTGKIDRRSSLSVHKPQVVIDYNNSMNAVDKQNQQLSSFSIMRRYAKGYKKVFFYMMDVAIFNSFVLHRMITGEKQHFTEFRMQLAEKIVESVHLPDYPRRGKPHKGPCPTRFEAVRWAHFVQFIPPTAKKRNPSRQCKVCSEKKMRSESRYECSKCLVALHIPDCFKIYHTRPCGKESQ